ncbi:Type VI secretion-associated protein, BMA A0400 family [Sulfitobacter noctilucae]|uniref:type VI secretion system-associated protein TagF n=1 Tax=Sulfitobacter noctilucae TaxID=1342302 RepID=UPI000468EAB9|nr:type VI secretion system-associated protein TagF [Sulfitobacter noctilucae]KIN70340.1 Type VI secretion-associated protein, BMA A0400 family [Sulfitobacter noctilucae]
MGQGFGAFGKIPALGDFFQLNTPPGFVRVWDDWLQGAMMAAAEAGGEAWDDQYMSAPIWRFTLSPGLAGSSKVLGVLMPSVDRVGRRFPLALMVPLPGDGPMALDHMVQEETFDQLETLALTTLEDGTDREHLAAGLEKISPPDAQSFSPPRRVGGAIVLDEASDPSIAHELAAGFVGLTGMAAPSLWSTLLQDTRRALICDGLPDAHQARALFDLNAPLWGDARPQG